MDADVPSYQLRIAAWLRVPVDDVVEASQNEDLLALVVAAAVDRMPQRAPQVDALRALIRSAGWALIGQPWGSSGIIEWAEALGTQHRIAVAAALRQLCGIGPADELDAQAVGMRLRDATAQGDVEVDGFVLRRVANRSGSGRWVVVDAAAVGDVGDQPT